MDFTLQVSEKMCFRGLGYKPAVAPKIRPSVGAILPEQTRNLRFYRSSMAEYTYMMYRATIRDAEIQKEIEEEEEAESLRRWIEEEEREAVIIDAMIEARDAEIDPWMEEHLLCQDLRDLLVLDECMAGA